MCPLMLITGKNRICSSGAVLSAARGSTFRHHYYNIDRKANMSIYAKFIKKMRTEVRIFINNHMKDLLPEQ